MTDTVELIIKIDKRAHKACQELRTNNDDGIIGLCAVNAIADGIPLDDVKAEIEKKHARAKQMSSVLQMNAYTDCLQIIDKYRAESE